MYGEEGNLVQTLSLGIPTGERLGSLQCNVSAIRPAIGSQVPLENHLVCSYYTTALTWQSQCQ